MDEDTTWHIDLLNSTIVSQHIDREQLSLKITTDFLIFPKWVFFHLKFGAKIFEIGHCVLIGSYHEMFTCVANHDKALKMLHTQSCTGDYFFLHLF